MTDSIPTELQEQIQAIQALPGRVSLYFENLKSGYRAQYNSTLPTIAASVIKIPVMVEFFCQVSEGKLDIEEFIEINDFTGKTVIPFATSASSGMGRSGSQLADMAGTGDWQEGQRFSSGASASDVQSWVNGLKF